MSAPTRPHDGAISGQTARGDAAAIAAIRAWGARVARPAAVLTVVYAVLAILFTWPLAAQLGRGVVSPIDPVDSTWRIAQAHDRLLHAPWQLFEANVLYPFPKSYLFDELVFGAALLTLPLRLFTDNPIAIYNLAVLGTFVLSALAMYALARRLRCHPLAAFAAGLIYAFAPLRFGQLDHIGLLSGQYFPLVILLLDRLFAPAPEASPRTRWRDAFLLAGVLALQALSSQYYALYLVFVVGGFVLLRLIQLGPRRFPERTTWARLLVAGGLAVLVVLPFAIGYLTVQEQYNFTRPIGENVRYSATIASFVTTGEGNWLWGGLTAPLRAIGRYSPERDLFVGLVALLLALVGVATAWRRPLVQYFLLLGAGSALLALGPGLRLTDDPNSLLFAPLPYHLLYQYLPGFDSMRVPARLGILYGLSIAGLAGCGLTWLLARLAEQRPRPGRASVPATPDVTDITSDRAGHARRWAAAALVIGAICVESANKSLALSPLESGTAVPPVYQWLATQPAGVAIELPFHTKRDVENNRYQYFSLFHRQRLVNGSADVVPLGYRALAEELYRGPSHRAVALLQGLGVTYVVIHYDRMGDEAAGRARENLGQNPVQSRQIAAFGTTVVYRLEETDRFAALRAAVPPDARIFLAQEKPMETYIGMLGWVLRDNSLHAQLPTTFGQRIAGPPDPDERYDCAVLHHRDDPAAFDFADATMIWEDPFARVYLRPRR